MGENSAYYNAVSQNYIQHINEIKSMLPQHTHGFINECLLKYQESTAYNYTTDLYFFYQYIKQSNPVYRQTAIKDIQFDTIKNLEAQDIDEFQNYVASGHKPDKNGNIKTVKERTIARKMATVRNYFKYLVKFDYIKTDPTIKAATKKKLKTKHEIKRLDVEQVNQFIDAVDNTNAGSQHANAVSELTAKRDLAIITLLLNTGIRVSECAGLDLSDVDFENNTITIVRKGGYADYLYINEDIRNTLRDYIKKERPTLLGDQSSPALFVSLKRNRLSIRSIQYMVEKYGKSSGLKQKLTPHKLRRTYGTALYNKTGDIYMVADVLGHKDVNTTVKHYAAVEEKHKQQAVQIDVYNDTDDANRY